MGDPESDQWVSRTEYYSPWTAASGPPHYAEDMRLRVLFFGVLRERFGAEEILEQFPGTTVSDLVRYYRAVSPELASLWGSIAVAVNQQYSAANVSLSSGDEVALLPPVSGGCNRKARHAG